MTTTTIENATQSIVAPNATIQTIDLLALAGEAGLTAGSVSNAEAYAFDGKVRLNDDLRILKEAGVDLGGDSRTNPHRKALRDGIAKAGLSEERIRAVVSFIAMYYMANVPVGTLSTNSAVKETIARYQEAKVSGENVAPNATKPVKTKEEKEKTRQENIAKKASEFNDAYTKKLLSDDIDVTINELLNHDDFYIFMDYVKSGNDVYKFADNMKQRRIEKEQRKAELLAQIEALKAQL